MSKAKSCFITGHRPSQFHFPESDPQCQKIKDTIAEEIKRLCSEEGIRGIWLGGAEGVDTWAAEIALELRKQSRYRGLQVYLAIPFSEFADRFSPVQKECYQRILKKCTDSVTVCEEYCSDAYKQRNYYIVNHSACGIAVYDQGRSMRSGTGMTVNYASKKRGLPITLIHSDTAEITTI